MIRTILISCILLLAGQAHGLVVEFKAAAEVADATVTLGDIAAFDEDTDLSRALASQPVAQSTSPGQEILIQTPPIVQSLSNRLDPGTTVEWRGAETVTITRGASEISSADVLRIIDTFILKNATGLPEAKIRFIPDAQPLPFSLPTGKVSWQVVPSDPQIIGSSRFSVIFSVDGRVRKNMSVLGRMEVLASVVVAAKDLRRGTMLSPQSLGTAVLDIANLREPIFEPKELIGKKLLVSTKAGAPLAGHQVEFPPLVKKGELVRMILHQGRLFLAATGIARNDGQLNETIRVQNTGSKKTVYCRVTGPGVVEVAL